MSFLKRRKIINDEKLSLLAKVFIAVLLVTVFEGAMRKWVSNGLTFPLVGLRDGLVLYGILWGLLKGQCYKAKYFKFLLLFSLILFFWGIVQLIVNEVTQANGMSPIVFMLGLRFWLLYLWFAFVVGVSMSDYDFKIITKLMVLLVVLMTPLVVLQHFSPPLSFINKQPVQDSLIFLVVQGIVRVTSTFSFTAGYTSFLAMATPFIFISLKKSGMLWNNNWMAVLGLIALLVSTIVSGSRGAIIFFGCFFMVYFIVNFFFSKGQNKILPIFLLLGLAAMLVVSSLVFDRAIDATEQRFETASQSENMGDRLIYTFTTQDGFSVLGEGLGLGSNAAGKFTTGSRQMLLAESENAKIILEIGILGVLVVLFEIFLVTSASYLGYRVAMRTGDISILLVWVAIAVALLTWPIIGQLTVNSLGYLLLALGIYLLRNRNSLEKANA